MKLWRKALPVTGPASGAATVAPRSGGYVYDSSSQWTLERGINKGMRRSIWVFRAVMAIASNQAKLPFVVREGDPLMGAPVAGHPLLRLMNQRPNPYESAVQFRTRLSAQLLLNRRGAFVEVVWSRAGQPLELHLLPPDTTRPLTSDSKFVVGYEVQLPGNRKDVLPPERVLWIRNPHPGDPYQSLTPLEAQGISIEVDHMVRLFTQSFLTRDGRPGGIVGVKGEMDTEVAEELEHRLNGGASQAGKVHVVEADDISSVDFGGTPRDAEHVETRRISREDILMAFGTPESVLGNASGRTWDNARTELLVFWGETMPPHLSVVSSPFDALDGNDETFAGFDLSEVSVLKEARMAERTMLLQEWQAGAISLDEYLEATGRQALGTAAAQSRYLPSGMLPFTEQPPGGALGEVVALESAQAKSAPFRRGLRVAPPG